MAQTAMESPSSVPKRPKGILKNSSPYQTTSPDARISPTSERPSNTLHNNDGQADTGNSRPGMPQRELSEKEVTQMNTELNAGGHRRNSSNPRGSISRRQSSQSGNSGAATNGVNGEHDESGVRLKWDEANLYLNEGQMGGKMKIDEPKTPYVRNYDASGEDDEVENINAQDLAVDELDMGKGKPRPRQASGARARESDIPGLDLGEPEMEPLSRRESDGERRVHVDRSTASDDGRHGEQEEGMSHEEREKHKKFEEMRKKHYEMKNIKNLLGHPEQLDALDDDEEK